MDVEAIIAAAKGAAKPEPYKLGECSIYIRRFTSEEQQDFLKMTELKAKTAVIMTKLFIAAFGLCDENNKPVFDDTTLELEPRIQKIDEGAKTLTKLMIDDIIEIEKIVMRKLGLEKVFEKKA